jgi:superfamily II DNA or RNA helicase
VVSSKVKGKKRLTNLTENDIVVGTMGAAREGLDRPDLSVVVFTTTFANENDFQQASGRVARACDGKVSSEAVFIVDHVPKCQDHAKLIARFARKRGYRVEHFQLEKQ